MSVLAGVAILVTLGVQLGARPFLDAVSGISWAAIAGALTITAGTTWCAARRWSLIAHRLGVGLTMPAAYCAYYRAQFLNATLPTGVVGEVDRAIWHGYTSRAMSRGVRSVVWDRVAGHLVLFGLVLVTIPALAPPIRSAMLWMLAAGIAVVLAVRLVSPASVQAVWREVRSVAAAPGVVARVLVLSTLAAAGHLAVFVIACRCVGVDASMLTLVPLGLVVLQVSAIPLGVAGWGPREGGAVLVFGIVGLGGGTGLAVSVAYGVLSTLATLPGMLAIRRRRVVNPVDESRGGTSWANAPTPS